MSLTSFLFELPRLVKGANWYIIYRQTRPSTGKKERIRVTFDINRIKNKQERLERAKVLMQEIAKKLPSGFPFQSEAIYLLAHTKVIEALEAALEVKKMSRSKTLAGYESKLRVFGNWLKDNNYDVLTISEIDNRIIRSFLDHIRIAKKRKPVTVNNYIIHLKSIFNELLDRKYVKVNPVVGVKQLKETQKERRTISDHEQRIILDYCKKEYHGLYLIILLIKYCFIRPGELRELKMKHLDIKQGVIRIPGTISKNKRNGVVTIPRSLLVLLIQSGYNQQPDNYFLFGSHFEANHKQLSRDWASKVHTRMIRHLDSLGKLTETKGLTLYSWKDTGGKLLIESNVPVTEVQKQMRHSDLSTTQRYVQQFNDISQAIRNIEITL